MRGKDAMTSYNVLFLLSLGFLLSCMGAPKVDTTKTQLQIREFQTRAYDTTDTKMVLKAVANVLQDDGYIIRDAEVELGIINAVKEADIESGGEKFLAILFLGVNARWKKNMIIESTINVSEFGKQTRVRANFMAKAHDNRGDVIYVQQVEDEQFYKDFFAKVDKGIFIQKEQL
jgi:hypothetical protein